MTIGWFKSTSIRWEDVDRVFVLGTEHITIDVNYLIVASAAREIGVSEFNKAHVWKLIHHLARTLGLDEDGVRTVLRGAVPGDEIVLFPIS